MVFLLQLKVVRECFQFLLLCMSLKMPVVVAFAYSFADVAQVLLFNAKFFFLCLETLFLHSYIEVLILLVQLDISSQSFDI